MLPDGDLLENSQYESSFTVNVWAKSLSTGQAVTFSMHTEGSPTTGTPARVWAMYTRQPFYGGVDRFSPHFGAQDGATPGYPYNKDLASVGNQQVSQRWRMYTAVYEPGKVTAYVDGIASVLYDYVEPDPAPGYTEKKGPYDKNPYLVGRPINRSTTEKALCIGAIPGHLTTGYKTYNFESGYLGGAGIFSGAWTPEQVMKVRLSTLMRGTTRDPIFQVDWEVQSRASNKTGSSTNDDASTGWRSLRSRGYVGYRGVACIDASTTNTSGAMHLYHVSSTQVNFLRRAGASPVQGPALAALVDGVGGLDISEIRRITFDLNSSGPGVPPVRVCCKVDGSWYASDQEFAVSASGLTAADWHAAEPQVFDVTLEASRWRNMTVAVGSELSVAGAPRAAPIPFGELQGIGIFQPSSSGGDLRVGALKVWNKAV